MKVISHDQAVLQNFTPFLEVKEDITLTMNSIHFFDTVEETYTLEYYFQSAPNTQGTLGKYTLDGGDRVIDDTPYKLTKGMSLWAKSNRATVKVFYNLTQE